MKDKPIFTLSAILDTLDNQTKDELLQDYIVDYASSNTMFIAKVVDQMIRQDAVDTLVNALNYAGENIIDEVIPKIGGVIV